jgi:hypothetical protein
MSSIPTSSKNLGPSAPALPPAYAEHSGEIAALMGWFFLKYLHSVYHRFEGDMVLPIVLGEIAHHNICDYFCNGKKTPAAETKRQQAGPLTAG